MVAKQGQQPEATPTARPRWSPAPSSSGLPPALIIGSSTDDVPNVDDYIWRVVMGCYAIRAFPREAAGNWVYLAAADSFANMVLDNLAVPPRILESRVRNGLTVDQFWQAVNQELGGRQLEQLECLHYDAWMQRLKTDLSSAHYSNSKSQNTGTR